MSGNRSDPRFKICNERRATAAIRDTKQFYRNYTHGLDVDRWRCGRRYTSECQHRLYDVRPIADPIRQGVIIEVIPRVV